MAAGRRIDRASQPKRQRGRPRVHQDAWAKVSVVLFERQIDRLDAVRAALSEDLGSPVTRAAVIRAAIDTLLAGPPRQRSLSRLRSILRRSSSDVPIR